jgi:hypothetical protein
MKKLLYTLLSISFFLWGCGGELPTDNGNVLKNSANVSHISEHQVLYLDTMSKIKGVRMIDIFYLVPPNVNKQAIQTFLTKKCDSLQTVDIWKNNPSRRSIHLRVYKSMSNFEDNKDEKYIATLKFSDTQYSKNDTPIIDFNKKQ